MTRFAVFLTRQDCTHASRKCNYCDEKTRIKDEWTPVLKQLSDKQRQMFLQLDLLESLSIDYGFTEAVARHRDAQRTFRIVLQFVERYSIELSLQQSTMDELRCAARLLFLVLMAEHIESVLQTSAWCLETDTEVMSSFHHLMNGAQRLLQTQLFPCYAKWLKVKDEDSRGRCLVRDIDDNYEVSSIKSSASTSASSSGH